MVSMNNDKIKFVYFIYSFFGWFLFIFVNLIQFIFFMPIVFLFSLIFDRDKKFFTYLTKIFSNLFHFLFFFQKIQYNKNGLKSQKNERRICGKSRFTIRCDPMYKLPVLLSLFLKKSGQNSYRWLDEHSW